jgi:hypothetical protein
MKRCTHAPPVGPIHSVPHAPMSCTTTTSSSCQVARGKRQEARGKRQEFKACLLRLWLFAVRKGPDWVLHENETPNWTDSMPHLYYTPDSIACGLRLYGPLIIEEKGLYFIWIDLNNIHCFDLFWTISFSNQTNEDIYTRKALAIISINKSFASDSDSFIGSPLQWF